MFTFSRRPIARTAFLAVFFVVIRAASPAAVATDEPNTNRPNIIVFYTDDHGYADLSCQGVVDDIKTPHVDALARSGVLARNGYSTAPQCVPSRAGLLVGRFQSRFGVESNGASLDGFRRETTLAERLQDAGYVTAQFGKWHLGPGAEITQHGFRHVYNQNAGRPFFANIDSHGNDRSTEQLMKPDMYHIDGCSHAAAALIRRYRDQPFFLYIAYRAPHVPLDAPDKYLQRFPGEMPQRRRQALAMLSAVDDGVGLISKTLDQCKLRDKTLIFYIGDNGAPLKIHKHDAPGGGPGWDGSLNDPLNGEKGMLSEGGMHVPFVVSWPAVIPGDREFHHPISALDVAATSLKAATVEVPAKELDGVDLLPFLSGRDDRPPHQALMWRWVAQSAIREGDWKLLRGGDREYLYNLRDDIEETNNLAGKHPEVVARLRQKLKRWADQLQPPGLATGRMSATWETYYDHYLDGKTVPFRPMPKGEAFDTRGWVVRNGTLEVREGSLRLVRRKSNQRSPFLVRSGFRVAGPAELHIELTGRDVSALRIAWRNADQKEFPVEQVVAMSIAPRQSRQKVKVTIPADGQIVHLRVIVPEGDVTLHAVKLGAKQLW